jgi:hypothetical protein
MAVMSYRTQDGLGDYGFSIESEPRTGWGVYIIFAPFLGNADSMNLPYQSLDDTGRRYVDWPTKLESLGDAKAVASLWAELIQKYQYSQEQHRRRLDLIQRCLAIQEQRKVVSAGRDSYGNAISTGESGVGYSYQGRAIPDPKTNLQRCQ